MYIILYYIILYYIIVYYIILYYTILYYIILYYTILYYIILYYTILYYIILYYTILYYIILYYTILYYIIYIAIYIILQQWKSSNPLSGLAHFSASDPLFSISAVSTLQRSSLQWVVVVVGPETIPNVYQKWIGFIPNWRLIHLDLNQPYTHITLGRNIFVYINQPPVFRSKCCIYHIRVLNLGFSIWVIF